MLETKFHLPPSPPRLTVPSKAKESSAAATPLLLRHESTGARQRLRRRMDVPYDPYSKKLTKENAPPNLAEITFVVRNGVFTTLSKTGEPLFEKPYDVKEYYEDLDELLTICNDGPVRSFSYTRLKLLEIRFKTHVQ